ncbi:hypothetical protein BDW72DRAFT_183966 [Aspergillus terricola var. indicus]
MGGICAGASDPLLYLLILSYRSSASPEPKCEVCMHSFRPDALPTCRRDTMSFQCEYDLEHSGERTTVGLMSTCEA